MTPRQLDWLINGVPVYIRARPADGELYATACDFSKFLTEEPIATVRVKFDKHTPADWVPEEDPAVLRKLEELRKVMA